MNRAVFAFFSLFIMILSEGYSQDFLSPSYSYTVSEPYEYIESKRKIYFQKGDYAIAIKQQGYTFHLQKFDLSRNTLIRSKSQDVFDRYCNFEDVLELKGRYFLFYTYYDNGKFLLKAREIDFDNVTFKEEPVSLLNTGYSLQMATNNKHMVSRLDQNEYRFAFNKSWDGSKLLITYNFLKVKEETKKEIMMHGAYVFSNDLKKISGMEYQLPVSSKERIVLDNGVDANGIVYVTAIEYDENGVVYSANSDKDRVLYRLNYYKIKLYSFDTKNKTVKSAVLGEEGKFLNGVWLFEAPGNQIICVGSFHNGKNLGNADGIYVARYGDKCNHIKSGYFDFTPDIQNALKAAREKRYIEHKKDDIILEMEQFDIPMFRFNPDGSMVLGGEQYYLITRSIDTGNGFSGKRSSYSNEMVFVKINFDGNLDWMCLLRKRYIHYDADMGKSFLYYFDQPRNEHVIIYHDHEKNVDLPSSEQPRKLEYGDKGVIAAFCINNETGSTRKEYILQPADLEKVKGKEVFHLTFNRFIPMNENGFVFETYKKQKEDILIKVQR